MGLQTHPEDSEHYLLRATVEAAPVKVGHADHSPSKSRQQAPPAMQSHMSCLKLFGKTTPHSSIRGSKHGIENLCMVCLIEYPECDFIHYRWSALRAIAAYAK